MNNDKAIWPSVVVVGLALTFVAVLLLQGVEVTQIVTVFSLLGNLVTLFLYRKIETIERNTNGTAKADREFIKDLVDTIKKAPAVKDE